MSTSPSIAAKGMALFHTDVDGLGIYADVGGTHSRLCLVGSAKPLAEEHYLNTDFASFSDVLSQFIKTHEINPGNSCFAAAIAGPIERQRCDLTNIDWTIDAADLQQQFGFRRALLLNDLEGAALGVLSAPARHTIINPGRIAEQGIALVVGIGTGLGMAYAIRQAGELLVFASEAGHIDFSPRNSAQTQIDQQLGAQGKRLCYEDLLSGVGIELIFKVLQPNAAPLDAMSISKRAHDDDSLAVPTMQVFADICAAYLANLALVFRPAMGIHLLGGVAAKNAAWLQREHFVNVFTHHNRMSHLLKQTAIRLYQQQDFGLYGAAIALNSIYGGGSHAQKK